ncbi:hypothetical protein K488DRAFT_53240 [Vararia minispora EC-137]|uniref:Uncharacterized protein n=1 Tax=Vararia minispora EC-137 TaxID=1314806 RepID=A0ACB8QH70_9AGAM|nr:hypothetical protein K488DRAFT_53240 [Vararia minispora EC-137]
MVLQLIIYGSREFEDVSEAVRFSDPQHQRRVEIELHPRLPRAGMSPGEIKEWGDTFVGTHYLTFKHSQKWHCEFCEKPARMSQWSVPSWTHLTPPRLIFYMHFVCDPFRGKCAQIVRKTVLDTARLLGCPPPPRHTTIEDPMEWPMMGSCATCNKDETVKQATKVCTGCNITRYCSEACQKKHWKEHRIVCKMPKTVTWVWD